MATRTKNSPVKAAGPGKGCECSEGNCNSACVHSITLQEFRQVHEFPVSTLLGRGAANAIPARDLVLLLGWHGQRGATRQVQLQVQRERLAATLQMRLEFSGR